MSTPATNPPLEPLSYKEIEKAEHVSIRAARARMGFRPSDHDANADLQDLSALCLSGGGMRSATFCLGCLQALDRRKMLRTFDYLSTVSGGGYIGSWLMALMKRSGDETGKAWSFFADVPDPKSGPGRPPWDKGPEIDPGDQPPDRNAIEPESLQFLRENSSYLTPHRGAFSGDTWSIVAIYMRNLLLNWLICVPLLAALITFPRLLAQIGGVLHAPWHLVAAIVCLAPAVIYSSTVPASDDVRQDRTTAAQNFATQTGQPIGWRVWLMQPEGFFTFRVIPFLLFLFFSAAAFHAGAIAPVLVCTGVFGIVSVLLFVLGFMKRPEPERKGTPTDASDPVRDRDKFDVTRFLRFNAFGFKLDLGFLLQTIGSLAAVSWAAAIVVRFVEPGLRTLKPAPDFAWFVLFPPIAVMTFLIAAVWFAGISDPLHEDENREWWARAAGYLLLIALTWLAWSVISLLPVYAGISGLPRTLTRTQQIGILFGSGLLSFLTRVEHVITSGSKWWQASGELARKAVFFAAMITFVGLLALSLSWATHSCAGWLERQPAFIATLKDQALRPLVSCFLVSAGCLVFSVGLSAPVDINRISAHIAYRNRLVRTFLGASNNPRSFNPFTGFSSTDNINLAELGRAEKRRNADNESEVYFQRPSHLLCAAVNLARGERLAWQDRRAVPFTFSVAHCGSKELGYRPTAQFGGQGGITLGTAMAVSGAAANSGMGFYGSPLKSFFLTLLNARLGWWLGNPNHKKNWMRTGPLFNHLPLLAELFSLTNRRYGWINVSDGGHFDNTGVYEMLRRRCRRILLIDADTTHTGIARASSNARVDFDAQLTLVPGDNGTFPCEHYKIMYHDGATGDLIRIYPVVGKGVKWATFENEEYGRLHEEFPNDPLVDQFFGQALFEGYRCLGLGIMEQVLETRLKAGDDGENPSDILARIFGLKGTQPAEQGHGNGDPSAVPRSTNASRRPYQFRRRHHPRPSQGT